MAINKSRDQHVDAYAAVVEVTTAALQAMPTQDATKGLARAMFLVSAGGVPVNPPGTPASTGTQSSVAGSAASVTILAANANRLGATIVNDSTAILYLLLSATGSASTTAYTVAMAPIGSVGSYYEVPFDYTGIIKGIWASATGNARVTEMTA